MRCSPLRRATTSLIKFSSFVFIFSQSLRFVGRIDKSVHCIFSVRSYKNCSKHPLHQPHLGHIEFANRQFQENFIPAFIQMDGDRWTCHTIFISQRYFITLCTMSSCPYRWLYFFIIDPDTATFIVPFTLQWSQVHFRTTIILEFSPQPYFLIFRRVNPCIGISRMILLRIFIESRYHFPHT